MKQCPECSDEMNLVDETFSNTGNNAGETTGYIYKCLQCDVYYIDDLVNSVLRMWDY